MLSPWVSLPWPFVKSTSRGYGIFSKSLAQILDSRHMDSAENKNVSTPTEHMRHLANKYTSMKACSPFPGHGTSGLQMKS
ncbi:hypothetical protein QYF61_020920 [Mycteria americana]|uniref:Uncharacterized protein n=1 Tax=Mycteria americana TaxID=33587 RepID=A0AAN7NML1_MYCAM|nr:hypothetical protein QYF61_020920 [Mycteria americana]